MNWAKIKTPNQKKWANLCLYEPCYIKKSFNFKCEQRKFLHMVPLVWEHVHETMRYKIRVERYDLPKAKANSRILAHNLKDVSLKYHAYGMTNGKLLFVFCVENLNIPNQP
jgi:hypothetical protein